MCESGCSGTEVGLGSVVSVDWSMVAGGVGYCEISVPMM